MSYPDLGCFAECLGCELCEGTLEVIDIFPNDVLMDSVQDQLDDDLWGPQPEPAEDPNFFDNSAESSTPGWDHGPRRNY